MKFRALKYTEFPTLRQTWHVTTEEGSETGYYYTYWGTGHNTPVTTAYFSAGSLVITVEMVFTSYLTAELLATIYTHFTSYTEFNNTSVTTSRWTTW